VADTFIEEGEWTSPRRRPSDTPVLDLIDTRSIYVSAPMDEVDSGRIRKGQPARLTVDSQPGKHFAARVVEVAPYVADRLEQNRTVEIELELDDAAVAVSLLPGTSADAELILSAKDGVLRVPTSALLEGGKVLVLEGGRLVEKPLQLGLRNWDFTEVTGGLEEGARVVVSLDRPEIKAGAKAGPRRRGRAEGGRMIRLEGISRTFDVGGEPVHALVDVHEEVAAGEHLAIMGPSGSGKSTLLHILGCLDRPDRGVYELVGRDVARLDEAELSLVRRHTIGFVFQFFHLVPRLTAFENVELPWSSPGYRPASDGSGYGPPEGRRARATGHAPARPALGRRAPARGDRPRDRPRPEAPPRRRATGNLDTTSGRHVLEILERMNAAGLTLIVVTHDPAVARRARRVLVLKDGRVVHRGDGAHIHEAVEILTAAENGE